MHNRLGTAAFANCSTPACQCKFLTRPRVTEHTMICMMAAARVQVWTVLETRVTLTALCLLQQRHGLQIHILLSVLQ